RAPARAHTEIQDGDSRRVGEVTSGGFGPSAGGPVAMGYVQTTLAKPGTKLNLIVRGQAMPAEVVTLPFVPHRYFKP
ncbi:MAG: glycine cleavage T C-terminal barrel domain-containing protein, partial [Rhodospirillaceae bacterium]